MMNFFLFRVNIKGKRVVIRMLGRTYIYLILKKFSSCCCHCLLLLLVPFSLPAPDVRIGHLVWQLEQEPHQGPAHPLHDLRYLVDTRDNS